MIEPIKPIIDAQIDWTFRRSGETVPPLLFMCVLVLSLLNSNLITIKYFFMY